MDTGIKVDKNADLGVKADCFSPVRKMGETFHLGFYDQDVIATLPKRLQVAQNNSQPGYFGHLCTEIEPEWTNFTVLRLFEGACVGFQNAVF